MSRLEELIQELCPNGVEYKKLTDVANVLYGYPCDATMFNEENNGIPLIRIRNVLTGMTETYTTENIPQEYVIKKGDLLVGMDGNFHVGNWKMDEAFLCQRVCKFYAKNNENDILNGFLSHLLGPIMKKIENGKQSGTVKHLLAKDINSISIPVPPLEVQREIVRILDSFTLLTAELTAELTARKKQYEYYRDELLGRKTVETKEVFLEDIATYSKERIPANEVDEYSYVGVDNLLQEKRGKTISSHVPTDGNLTKYYPGDILIGNIRPYLRKIWFADNIGGTNGDVLVINVTSDKVLPQYLYYNLSSERFFEYDIAKSKGAKMPRGDKDAVMKYNLLLPPIATQKRIVDVLNNFEKICNDISEGLPAEIEARQKQYEFYRDKLLSFKQL
ncbi:MAG: restriction endonuclease subunit S [Finegoldia magna]|uniref:restriction endonuclease subunit S n=1 Tax=Finegoldia magna TaxID=1260 RepID=UPI002907D936|nr:restriction endonuclease subunit S [Finegoldia magna]MDU7032852.1 restriction endonuclease subunit S [Finegoldia magna]